MATLIAFCLIIYLLTFIWWGFVELSEANKKEKIIQVLNTFFSISGVLYSITLFVKVYSIAPYIIYEDFLIVIALNVVSILSVVSLHLSSKSNGKNLRIFSLCVFFAAFIFLLIALKFGMLELVN
jgi:hypothetical protein